MCHPGRVRPTLRTVLTSAAMRPGRPEILSGAGRLDAPVRWVHVGEVRELAALLRGGELILSTGLAMRGDTESAVRYVEELVAAGAAGLVVELGREFPAVPDGVVRAARDADFPLVVLHERVRFVEVTEEVHRAIVAEQLEHVEFSREVHETFTRLSLEAADAEAIVRTTAELGGSSVVLEDLGRHVLAFAALGRPAAGLLADWERRSRSAPAFDHTGITGPEGWLTAPVGLPGSRWGRLIVANPQLDQLRLTMLVERAAQALVLARMVERDRLGLSLRAQGGLLSELAEGRLDEETADARARALGLAGAPSYVAVVARSLGQSGDDIGGLLERLSTAVDGAALSGLVGPLTGTEAGVLLAVPPRRGEGRVLDALADRLPDDLAVLGVGPSSGTVAAAGAGLRQARHVAETAAMPGSSRRPYHRVSDLRLHGLVALLQDDPRMQAFVEAELAPLLEHEAARDDGSFALLRQYVASGGNKTRLAAASHRSRASVYKRLERLERVLGVDLDDPVSLMSLGVAVIAYDHARHGGS
jgi:PucR family transcriptional regulator, purine catabolism regulatory protein